MRDGQKAFIFLAFFWAGLAGTHADDPKQTPTPTILVVEPFDGTKAEVPGWQAATGQGVSQMLIETLENSEQKFQVLEIPEPPAPQNSSASNSVSGQTKPTATGSSASKKSGAASKKTAADETIASDTTATNQAAGPAKPSIDETIGSDFTIYGDVTQFMTQTNGGSLGGLLNSLSSLGGKVYTAHVEIAWRIEDSVTKKNIKRLIIATGTGSGSEFVMSPATTATTGGKTAAGGTSADIRPLG